MKQNGSTDVTFDRIDMTGSVSETFQRLRFGTVRVAVNGSYRRIGAIDRLRPRAGDVLHVRVPLIGHHEQRPNRTVDVRLRIPKRLASGRCGWASSAASS